MNRDVRLCQLNLRAFRLKGKISALIEFMQAAKDIMPLDLNINLIEETKSVVESRDRTASKLLLSKENKQRGRNFYSINSVNTQLENRIKKGNNLIVLGNSDYRYTKPLILDIKRYKHDAMDRKEIVRKLRTKIETLEKGGKYYNLITILSDKDYLINFYNQIKSKPGNMTKGIDNETLDGIGMKYFDKLSEDLKRNKFTFRPGRGTEIPKKDGLRTRQLTVLSPRDKIVQKAILNIMQEI